MRGESGPERHELLHSSYALLLRRAQRADFHEHLGEVVHTHFAGDLVAGKRQGQRDGHVENPAGRGNAEQLTLVFDRCCPDDGRASSAFVIDDHFVYVHGLRGECLEALAKRLLDLRESVQGMEDWTDDFAVVSVTLCECDQILFFPRFGEAIQKGPDLDARHTPSLDTGRYLTSSWTTNRPSDSQRLQQRSRADIRAVYRRTLRRGGLRQHLLQMMLPSTGEQTGVGDER